MRALLMICAFALAGCDDSFDPISYVNGLRVLAVVADPPEAMIGGTSTLSVLATDTSGEAIHYEWAVCRLITTAGEIINEKCNEPSGESIIPAGSGPSITVTMPSLPPISLANPPD